MRIVKSISYRTPIVKPYSRRPPLATEESLLHAFQTNECDQINNNHEMKQTFSKNKTNENDDNSEIIQKARQKVKSIQIVDDDDFGDDENDAEQEISQHNVPNGPLLNANDDGNVAYDCNNSAVTVKNVDQTNLCFALEMPDVCQCQCQCKKHSKQLSSCLHDNDVKKSKYKRLNVPWFIVVISIFQVSIYTNNKH